MKSNFSKYKKPRKSAVKMNGRKFVTNSLLLTFSFQRFRAAKKLFSQLVSELHSITKRLFTKWVTLKAFWTFWMPSGEIQVNGTETNKRQKGSEKIQFYGNNQKKIHDKLPKFCESTVNGKSLDYFCHQSNFKAGLVRWQANPSWCHMLQLSFYSCSTSNSKPHRAL